MKKSFYAQDGTLLAETPEELSDLKARDLIDGSITKVVFYQITQENEHLFQAYTKGSKFKEIVFITSEKWGKMPLRGIHRLLIKKGSFQLSQKPFPKKNSADHIGLIHY